MRTAEPGKREVTAAIKSYLFGSRGCKVVRDQTQADIENRGHGSTSMGCVGDQRRGEYKVFQEEVGKGMNNA